MEVAEIQSELRRLGLTQEALAKHLGIHKGDVSKLLSGKVRMRLDTFRKIEAFLAGAERHGRRGGVAETGAPFQHRGAKFVTLEEARKMSPAAPLSAEDSACWRKQLFELGEAGRRLPRITDKSDDEILGYDEME